MTDVTIAFETPRQPDVQRLFKAADERLASLYPGESRPGPTAETLVEQNVCCIVVRLDARAIGCGGFIADEQNCGELKRIFVDEFARGRGVGRLILEMLEKAACDRGISTMRLETGIKSTEAIGLYRSFGYWEREPFGSYRSDPLSIFMEKCLS